MKERPKKKPELTIDFSPINKAKQAKYPDMSDTEFAKMLGVKQGTYSDYKNQKGAIPSLQVALTAAIILDLDLRELVPQRNALANFFA